MRKNRSQAEPVIPDPSPGEGDRSESLPLRALDTYRGWPKWLRIAAPAFVALLGIGALTSGEEEPTVEAAASEDADLSTTSQPEFDDPVAETSEVLDEMQAELSTLSHDQLVELVMSACVQLETKSTTEDVSNAVVESLDDELETVTASEVEGFGDILDSAAPELCPDGVAAHPTLIRTLARKGAAMTPTTTAPPTTTTAAPTTTAVPVTAPPTTVPPPPPTTAAPQPAAPSVYYKNCDAARAAGAAPVRVGDPGYASHLDRDGDGVGCE